MKAVRDNRILCTFTTEKDLGVTVETLKNKYTIIYSKIFVLDLVNSEEILVTYNIDIPTAEKFLSNTVLVHRKKETNTLYTINALNVLIKSLNGNLDSNYPLDWNSYRNSLLLTRDHIFYRLETRLRNIVQV